MVVSPPESVENRQVRKMNNGYINQIRGTTRGIPQVTGDGISAHKTNRGKKSEDGRILAR